MKIFLSSRPSGRSVRHSPLRPARPAGAEDRPRWAQPGGWLYELTNAVVTLGGAVLVILAVIVWGDAS